MNTVDSDALVKTLVTAVCGCGHAAHMHDWRDGWCDACDCMLAWPEAVAGSTAMRDLLADTARTAEGKVIERVEALYAVARAEHDPTEGVTVCLPLSLVRAALRASEADRG